MTSRLWDLAELYESEQISLRAFVRRIVGNTATAEDVVQQAFLNLLSRYEDTAQAPGPAYVKRTARNLALNHLRDARRRADVEIEVDEPERFADDGALSQRASSSFTFRCAASAASARSLCSQPDRGVEL